MKRMMLALLAMLTGLFLQVAPVSACASLSPRAEIAASLGATRAAVVAARADAVRSVLALAGPLARPVLAQPALPADAPALVPVRLRVDRARE